MQTDLTWYAYPVSIDSQLAESWAWPSVAFCPVPNYIASWQKHKHSVCTTCPELLTGSKLARGRTRNLLIASLTLYHQRSTQATKSW